MYRITIFVSMVNMFSSNKRKNERNTNPLKCMFMCLGMEHKNEPSWTTGFLSQSANLYS